MVSPVWICVVRAGSPLCKLLLTNPGDKSEFEEAPRAKRPLLYGQEFECVRIQPEGPVFCVEDVEASQKDYPTWRLLRFTAPASVASAAPAPAPVGAVGLHSEPMWMLPTGADDTAQPDPPAGPAPPGEGNTAQA